MASFGAGANAFLSSPLKIVSTGPNISTQRGSASVINAHPKENKIIYPSGKFIVIRNLENPDDCFIYRGHAHQTTVAKFAPNGFWVCSADVSGKVRVWSWDHPEHLTKLETQVFNGPVYDLDWDMESKKIVAVGDGAGMSAKCFMWDTGNSVGEIVGHAKRILSVSYKPTRPFRIMTASEDMRTLFFAGPPFKLDHSNNSCHTNFVNCVRYSSNGATIASVSSDKKIQFYDGATGQPSGEVANAHAGTIFACSFSPDGSKLATASADKTVKVWDVESKACVMSHHFSEDAQVGDMQVGLVWAASGIITVSLNGNINILSADSPTPVRTIQGHQVSITSMYLDRAHAMLYTGSFDGVIIARSLATVGDAHKIVGDKKSVCCGAHNGKVVGLGFAAGSVWSVGWDDRLRSLDASTSATTGDVALLGQPVCMAHSTDGALVAVATASAVQLFSGTSVVASITGLSFGPTSIALWNSEEVAVGGDDSKVHVYSVSGASLTLKHTIDGRNIISSLAYSPDGLVLAVGDAGRVVECYRRENWESIIKGHWVYHTSRITSLSWSPSGNYLCSGALDENVIVWNFRDPKSMLQIPFAHMGGVSAVDWLDENTLVTCGSDQTIVTWNVSTK